ncbi:MAG: radical SAM protein [Synergistaceae bacterium]|nr:radical SAM protein [Synergistaceae bacterium]
MTNTARWWKREKDGARCGLCFHRCFIPPGSVGYCEVREWDGDVFSSPCLGRFSSCAVDPIEKKPLYHWRPGSYIFSLGSVGCNMRCPFCQNHRIAQPAGGAQSAQNARKMSLTPMSPLELVRSVKREGLSAVAYTYNEPTLQAEYILQAAPLLKEAGIASVLVTNGMFSAEARDELAPWVGAANVDVKTFDPVKYTALGGSLDVVKENVASWVRAGVHVELTNLVVPGISDSREDFTRMVDWVAEISPAVPLHISRYFPAHKYAAPPTSVGLMKAFEALAGRRLTHVHLGNVF